jgi:enoyl-CoA hydratase/carnithine racemase
MTFQSLRCDVAAPGVARIELARGADQNPLDVQLCVELVGALGFIRDTADVRAAVITHKGPFFCSGGELGSETDPDTAQKVGPLTEVLRAFRSVGKPIVAAIDGRVQGAGLALVLAADVAIASLPSSFLVPEARVGLWSFHLLPDLVRVIGRRRAMLLLLEGGAITSGDAAGIGLITRIASGDPQEEALAMAQRYAALSPTALRMGLTAMRKVENPHYDEQLAWLQDQADALRVAPDTREAEAAFRERRSPEWGKS